LSPVLTARTLPESDQEQRQATASKGRVVDVQSAVFGMSICVCLGEYWGHGKGQGHEIWIGFALLTSSWVCCRCSPDSHSLVLRGARDVALAQDRRCPGHVPHPVGVACEFGYAGVGLRVAVVVPDLDVAVTPSRDEPPQWALLLLSLARGAGHGPRRHAGGPAHGIDAQPMRRNQLADPLVALELQHADIAIRACSREHAAALVGSPSDQVHAGAVLPKVVDLGPGVGRRLAPYDDAAVVRGGGEQRAEFGVGPADAPHGLVVAFEGFG
jgi:hypothetical protein